MECRDYSCGSAVSITMVWGALSIAEIIFASRKLSCGSDDGMDDDGAMFAHRTAPRWGLMGQTLRYWLICLPCNVSRGWVSVRRWGYQFYHHTMEVQMNELFGVHCAGKCCNRAEVDVVVLVDAFVIT